MQINLHIVLVHNFKKKTTRLPGNAERRFSIQITKDKMFRIAASALTRRASIPLCHLRSTATITQSRYLTNDKDAAYDVVPKEDFGELKEYSVIFTNRSLNLMSEPFQKVMRDLDYLLKQTYNAHKVAIIPG